MTHLRAGGWWGLSTWLYARVWCDVRCPILKMGVSGLALSYIASNCPVRVLYLNKVKPKRRPDFWYLRLFVYAQSVGDWGVVSRPRSYIVSYTNGSSRHRI